MECVNRSVYFSSQTRTICRSDHTHRVTVGINPDGGRPALCRAVYFSTGTCSVPLDRRGVA